MLNTILEYRKGILFVRLDGQLVSSNIKFISSSLIPIIERDKLENIVINMENISSIDLKGIHFIFYLYEMCKKNKGILMLSNINEEIKNKLKKNKVFKYAKELNNELESFRIKETIWQMKK